ncbi:hypothetical protein [Blastopirellula marina]|uniref:Uncharacterized protein n=1 Tax=Blastopirellula marina TaxID=124 RepID=A0A2S8GLT3_9BACT|nr:hypothetical protein [Blastopirellula marina]PQO45281.1 hypothetical protein C5Y93_15100 [Blastopirellula marina]
MPELTIVLQRQIPGLDPHVDSRVISESEPILERLARRLNVVPLMEFYSQDPVKAVELMLGHPVDPGQIELPERNWFSSQQGLETVQTLREHLQKHPASVPDPMGVLAELTQWREVLTRASQENVPWHVGVEH